MSRVSEAVREREVFKFASHLYEIAHGPDVPKSRPQPSVPSSPDPVLTALAQLGAVRLGASRCMISTFDRTNQYVVAEATPTSALGPGPASRGEIQIGTSSFPRNEGICEQVLSSEPATRREDAALPVLFVPDLLRDVRFQRHACVADAPQPRFYAGVPIRSPRGIDIGVYCVVGDQPRDSLDSTQAQVLREMSQTIMGYLESKRSNESFRRSDRMVRGIGSFVEGKSTISKWWFGPDAVPAEEKIPLRPDPSPLQRERSSSAPVSKVSRGPLTPATPTGSGWMPSPTTTKMKSNALVSSTRTSEDEAHALEIRNVFGKAANIIREAIEVEGAVFLDARIGSFGGLVPDQRKQAAAAAAGVSASPLSTPGSEDSMFKQLENMEEQCCEVLGYSMSNRSSLDPGAAESSGIAIPEGFLKAMLKRYPEGKTFALDEDGSFQTGDSSEEEWINLNRPSSEKLHSVSENYATTHSRHDESRILGAIFPAARSVAFIPLWDQSKEKWFAGSFVWTTTPTRTFTIDGELNYLRVFGLSLSSIIARVDSMLAEKAKSDLLGSLSHELRSPLHGIVAAVELLQDTNLDAFQGDILHSMECCGRTLLDVVDHLLDYSKINRLIKDAKDRSRNGGHYSHARRSSTARQKSFESRMTNLFSNVDLAALTEESIESVCVGYNLRKMSIAQLAERNKPGRHGSGDAFGHHRGWSESSRPSADKVSVYLDIDPRASWMSCAQAGAIRRIIMNLLGNSLKYTDSGYIVVTVTQDFLAGRGNQAQKNLKLTISDSGKGISNDFLRNHLFTAFSQEDTLDPGTGLGLRLVQQIAKVLGGTIHLESQLGCGTTVTVLLPMPEPWEKEEMDSTFYDYAEKLKGLRVGLRGFKGKGEYQTVGLPGKAPPAEVELVGSLCRDWLHLDVVAPESTDVRPDLIMCTEESLGELVAQGSDTILPPVVVVCHNALSAHGLATLPENANERNIFEYISHPAGPRKVARAFVLAYSRWNEIRSNMSNQGLTTSRPSSAAFSSSYTASRAASPVDEKDCHSSPQPARAHIMHPTIVSGEEGLASADESAIQVESPMEIKEMHVPHPLAPIPMEISPPNTISPIKFLLVDDNKINLQILVSFMKKLKRPYHTANNGLEALRAYQAEPGGFCCVLMDISMPIMNGLESTRHIREFECTHGRAPATVIALTGLASADVQREAFASGIDMFMTKPVPLRELGDTLTKLGLGC